MNNTYYFPISSLTLADYFVGACIKAAKYFNNKPQDIQDRNKDFLLLTSKKGTTETDCCLELVLTNDEIKDLIDVKNGWYLFGTKPLPITRIKKIYFSDSEQMDVTVTNITMSTAFVPKDLIEICNFEDNKTTDIQVPSDCAIIDQIDKIIQFDRFLGALALMRLAHEPDMNYSQNYIATLSLFNQTINNKFKESNEKVVFNDNYPFQGVFNNSKGFEKILPYLNRPINEESLNLIAKEEGIEIKKDKFTRKIDIESINETKWTYIVAILNTYGVGDESRAKRIDGLIQSNFSTLKKQEGVALCYGYNRGYSVFTKNYGNVAFKYRLESQLDYYTIESVYQYVFNGNVPSEFSYLDSWCPKLQPKLPKRSTEYVILDELIIGKKKPKVFSPEWWNGFSQKLEKTFGSLAKPIVDLIKNFVETDLYSDIRDEIQEDIESKQQSNKMNNSLQEELNRAKEELLKANERNRQLEEELNNQRTISTQYPIEEKAIQGHLVVAEPETNYGNTINSTEEKLKSAIIKYKDCSLDELKKKIKPKPTDATNISDLLLKQPADLFS